MPVPTDLKLPDFEGSLRLQIADHRLIEAGRGGCASNLDSIRRAVSAEYEREALTSRYPGLLDELGIHVRPKAADDTGRLVERALLEFEALTSIEHGLTRDSLDAPDLFLELLRRIHHAVKGGESGFRTKSVIIRPDSSGSVTIFPPWQLCAPLLLALASFVAQNFSRAPGLCATVAFAGVIHAHPFRDGNGRTARVLFNLLMRRASGTEHFVPLSKFTALSRGGFVIKLRRALYGGEWQPLVAFYADALALSHELQKEPVVTFMPTGGVPE
jgi:hypothetical protein